MFLLLSELYGTVISCCCQWTENSVIMRNKEIALKTPSKILFCDNLPFTLENYIIQQQ